jgi:hypothetical protein
MMMPGFGSPQPGLGLPYDAHGMLLGGAGGHGGALVGDHGALGGHGDGGIDPMAMFDASSPLAGNSPTNPMMRSPTAAYMQHHSHSPNVLQQQMHMMHSPNPQQQHQQMLHSPNNQPQQQNMLHSPFPQQRLGNSPGFGPFNVDPAIDPNFMLPGSVTNSPQFQPAPILQATQPLLSRPAAERRQTVRAAADFFAQQDRRIRNEAMHDDQEERKEPPKPLDEAPAAMPALSSRAAAMPPPPPPPPSAPGATIHQQQHQSQQHQPSSMASAPFTPLHSVVAPGSIPAFFTPNPMQHAMPPLVNSMLPSPLYAPIFWQKQAAMAHQASLTYQAAAAMSAAAMLSPARGSPGRVVAGTASPNAFVQASRQMFRLPASHTPTRSSAAAGMHVVTPAVAVSASQVVMAAASGGDNGRRALFPIQAQAFEPPLEPFGTGESVRFSQGVLLKLIESWQQASSNAAELLPSETPFHLYRRLDQDRNSEFAERLRYKFSSPVMQALFQQLTYSEYLDQVQFLATVTSKWTVHAFQIPAGSTLLMWRPVARETQGDATSPASYFIKVRTWAANSARGSSATASTSSALEATITSILHKKTSRPSNGRFYSTNDVAGWVNAYATTVLLPQANNGNWISHDAAGWMKLAPVPFARLVAVCIHPEVTAAVPLTQPTAAAATKAVSAKARTKRDRSSGTKPAAAASSAAPAAKKQTLEHFAIILPPEIRID